MTRFIIFRHGQTDWNSERRIMGKIDIPLNTIGKIEAEKLASRLRNESIQAFYSSPLTRSLQTTKIVARTHKKTVDILEDLIEMDMGVFEGKTKSERVNLFPEFDVANDKHREKMGMDLFSKTVKKLKKQFIPMLLGKHPSQTIALGTHDQKMRAILMVLGMPHVVTSEVLKNCAITIIKVKVNGIEIICHNDNSHLLKTYGRN